MIRGTTPTLTFTTPYESDMISSGFITFTMRGKFLFEIEINDDSVEISDYAISVTLTQEQTLLFDSRFVSLVQVRLILSSGEVVASNVVTVPIEDILKDGTI